MSLTPADVDNKTFPLTNRLSQGYECGDVDVFLDQVKDALVALHAENDELKRQLELARSAAPEGAPATPSGEGALAAAPGESGEQGAMRLLLHAQRTADAAIDDARQEAERIRAEAARREAELDTELAARREQSVAELERERDTLASRVEALRAFDRETRDRLRGWFSEQIQVLESREEPPLPPADLTGPASGASAVEGGGASAAPASGPFSTPPPLVPSSPAEPVGPAPQPTDGTSS